MTRVDAGWMGGGRPPAGLAQGQPQRSVGVARAVELDLGVDAQVRDAPGGGRQIGPDALP